MKPAELSEGISSPLLLQTLQWVEREPSFPHRGNEFPRFEVKGELEGPRLCVDRRIARGHRQDEESRSRRVGWPLDEPGLLENLGQEILGGGELPQMSGGLQKVWGKQIVKGHVPGARAHGVEEPGMIHRKMERPKT